MHCPRSPRSNRASSRGRSSRSGPRRGGRSLARRIRLVVFTSPIVPRGLAVDQSVSRRKGSYQLGPGWAVVPRRSGQGERTMAAANTHQPFANSMPQKSGLKQGRALLEAVAQKYRGARFILADLAGQSTGRGRSPWLPAPGGLPERQPYDGAQHPTPCAHTRVATRRRVQRGAPSRPPRLAGSLLHLFSHCALSNLPRVTFLRPPRGRS